MEGGVVGERGVVSAYARIRSGTRIAGYSVMQAMCAYTHKYGPVRANLGEMAVNEAACQCVRARTSACNARTGSYSDTPQCIFSALLRAPARARMSADPGVLARGDFSLGVSRNARLLCEWLVSRPVYDGSVGALTRSRRLLTTGREGPAFDRPVL